MAQKTLDVRGIVKMWLRDHGYDGLCSKHCGCELEDLMPCAKGSAVLGCRPGYRTLVLNRPGWVFIGLDRARTPQPIPYAPHPDPAGPSRRYGPAAGAAIPLSRAVVAARRADTRASQRSAASQSSNGGES